MSDPTGEWNPPPWGPDTDPDDWLYEESEADRAADASYREYLDDLDNPEPTGAAATPDTASFDALDAWWAEADRTGDASAAHAYAQDFQDTADHAAAGDER